MGLGERFNGQFIKQKRMVIGKSVNSRVWGSVLNWVSISAEESVNQRVYSLLSESIKNSLFPILWR